MSLLADHARVFRGRKGRLEIVSVLGGADDGGPDQPPEAAPVVADPVPAPAPAPADPAPALALPTPVPESSTRPRRRG